MASETPEPPRRHSWNNFNMMIDGRDPDEVEVKVAWHEDGLRLWVNVNGACWLRIYGIDPTTYNYVEDLHGRDRVQAGIQRGGISSTSGVGYRDAEGTDASAPTDKQPE